MKSNKYSNCKYCKHDFCVLLIIQRKVACMLSEIRLLVRYSRRVGVGGAIVADSSASA